MGGEWQEMTLADISSDVAYGYTESATDQKVGPHFLRITDIQNGIVNWANVPYCQISAENRQKYRLQKGDIVVARTGNSTGENYLYQGDEDAVFASYLIRFRVDHTKADPRFVWYNLRSRNWWNFINNSKTGSAQAGANAQILGRFPLSLPRLDEQRAIAHILGTLDDKIELNRRINETLEAMARALFRSWFLDFDPVRAKAEGRDPGLPKDIAGLFPDSFDDSEIGEIPNGWKVSRFGDVVEQLRDQENPLSSPDALFHHYSLPAFDDGKMAKVEYGENIKSIKSRVPAGTILLSKLNPEIERVWMADIRRDERAVCSTEFLVLRGRPPFGRNYTYCLARSPIFRQQIEGLVTGTSKSHQRAQVDSILNIEAVIPPSSIVAAFEQFATDLLGRTFICRRESRTLDALRDTLLPKLISGELRLKHADAVLENVL